MKRYFAYPLLCLALLIPNLARTQDMQFKQVAPGIFAHIGGIGARTYENGGMNANSGFIVTKVGVVVVDSGSSDQVAQQIHTAIRKVTKLPVTYVINTGGQDHRWLGNGYFKAQGAEIVASSATVEDMKARGVSQIEGLKSILREKFGNTERTLPTRSYEKEFTLNQGGRDIRILHFQAAHTPGDSIVWLPKEGVLFAGDIVYVDRLLGVMAYSNVNSWLSSFEEMIKLKPRLIIPGHGDVCDLAKAQKETGDYLRLLITYMGKAVDKGEELQQAINRLDQSAFAYLANYELLKGANASRVYLEMESR
ncbi:MAG: MBL fold metallo-hydrolase [Gallionellaceae bacterium]